MTQHGRPRRKPPWWPEGERWPPEQGDGPWGRHVGGGEWGSRRGGMRRPFGCVFIVLVLVAAGMLTIAVWALAALLGFVGAPIQVRVGGLVALVVVGVLIAAGFRGIRRMSVPLDDIADAAERIERGDYSTRVDETGPRRVRSLARAFNQMSARLASVDAGRRAFLADAAHELRTPLAIIEAQIEAIGDGLYPADEEHLAPIHEQIRALEKLIDNMRTVALADSGALTLELAPVDLGATIDQAIAAFRPEATAAGVELSAEVTVGLPKANADEQRVRQVLSNLLANALHHTPRGGSVKVSASAADTPGWLSVRVSDDGTGIAPELLPTVFERFVKEPGSTGSGLGLAICRDVIEAHGGKISISSTLGRRTEVSFTLPS